jgi:hypothetical protein
MTARRIAAVAAALVTLTACSSSTSGTGAKAAAPPTRVPASSSVASSAPAAPTAPTTSAAPSVTVVPAPSAPVRTATVHAGPQTYVIKVWAETTDADCPAHAYGTPVIAYLKAHTCSAVMRLLATTVVGGKGVGFAQSTLTFKGTAPQVYTTAGDFRTLVTQDGTGNVDDLLREGRRLPSGPTAVPSPDAFSALAQDGGVAIVDAWYLDGPTPDNDPALVRMAHDIFLQD